MLAIGKAFQRASLPTEIVDARVEKVTFQDSARYWRLMGATIGFGGVVVTIFGERIINFMTHGKFGDSYVFVVCWAALLLVRYMGRPSHALSAALGLGRQMAVANLVSAGAGILALIVLVPLFGVWGAVVSAFVLSGTNVILMRMYVGNSHPTFIWKARPIYWIVLIAVSWIASSYFEVLLVEIMLAALFLMLVAIPIVAGDKRRAWLPPFPKRLRYVGPGQRS